MELATKDPTLGGVGGFNALAYGAGEKTSGSAKPAPASNPVTEFNFGRFTAAGSAEPAGPRSYGYNETQWRARGPQAGVGGLPSGPQSQGVQQQRGDRRGEPEAAPGERLFPPGEGVPLNFDGLWWNQVNENSGEKAAGGPQRQPPAAKAFGGYRAAPSVSPYYSLFSANTSGGTADPFTSTVLPQLQQQQQNLQFNKDINTLQNQNQLILKEQGANGGAPSVSPYYSLSNANTRGGTIDPYMYLTEEQKQELVREAKPAGGEGQPGAKSRIRQKPVETWKPSRLAANTSRLMVGDNEELPLRGMQVDVRIDGFRARVVLDLYYFNDQPRQLEGNFQLRLPEEASPYFFAFGRTVYQARQVQPTDSMFFKRDVSSWADTTPEQILAVRRGSWEEPKVARMATKEKAAFAYRETVRRRIDPALVEWSGAGVFQCRVFPLAPQSLHRVVIGYDVDLLRVGDDLELRLDLPQKTPACVVDFNIAAQSAHEVSLDAPATKSADGQRLSYRLIDPQDRPLVVRLREPATTMLVGGDGKTGNYFALRTTAPLLGEAAGKSSSQGNKDAIFLVDVSLRAGPQFPLWTKLMRAVLANNRDRIERFAVVFFNVETFWWQEKFVANTPENVERLMNYADGLALEGATDLGRALNEAAAPAWLKQAGGPRPELFLLSDGAGTWGEDRWAIIAAGLKAANSGPLFAYQTGLSGSDPQMLAHLAQETGGAVFAVVGEAEIARASTAQRQRPWRLAGVEVSGGRDVLVAGRPQCVFPGEQLLVVGRCEPGMANGEVILTLQQGETTETVRTKIDRVLASELAPRAYGQVAVGQLEDVAVAAEGVEPIATGYARHFRVTGRTCSLLMLESEQDYARFHIKPEEDDFLVSDRPAAAIVAKAAADSAAAQGDPKAGFLAWFRGLEQSSGVHFDLPASLAIALQGLPKESFAVAAPPLRCKLHAKEDLTEDVRQALAAGAPDYETLAAESQRRLARYGADDALRALSSLVEEHPGDAAVARDVAFSAIAWERPGEAYHLLRRAAAGRSFEPIAFHALAHCLEQMGNADLAIVYYELACGGQWDARFGDMHNIAQFDYYRFLRRLSEGGPSGMLGNYARARLATLAAAQVRDTADLAALVIWNTDGTNVDLHVTEPSGEQCDYTHRQTASGGQISRDVTTGYGPEIYILLRAPLGIYSLRTHYFAADANRASTRTKVLALIYQGWGTKAEKLTVKAPTLTNGSEWHDLAKIAIGQ